MGGREGRQGRAYGLRTMGEFGHKVELSYEYGLPASIRASPLPAFSARGSSWMSFDPDVRRGA